MPLRESIVCLMLFGCLALPICSVRGQDVDDIFDAFEVPWLTKEKSVVPERAEPEKEEEPLETDRDSFTIATTTVGTGRFLYESAYTFIENRNTPNDQSFPEIVTRYGLTDRLEFRLGWNYEVGGGGSVSNGDSGGELEERGLKQETQLLYGFKYSLTKQQSWIPQSAIVVQATTPTSGSETFTDKQVGYVFGWKLPNDWQLDSSIRYVSTKEEGDQFNEWAPSIVLKVPVAKHWNAHGEYFGIFTDGKAQARNAQYFSPGIHYLVTPNCEVGVRFGWGLNEDAANFFTNVGFGLRL